MGNVRRRQLMGGKPKPKDIVNVYNYTVDVTTTNGTPFGYVLWFNFKVGPEYDIEAIYDGYQSDSWFLEPQNYFVLVSGSKNSWSNKVHYTGYFTAVPHPNRFTGYISKAYGGTVTVKITETIHPN